MDKQEYELMSIAEESMWWYRALHRKLIQIVTALALPGDAVVLDAGCGTGGFSRRLGGACPGLRLVGIELDENAAALCRGKAGGDVACGDVARMPFRAGEFDAVVAADVLYHKAVDERSALAEFRRCLKPGGSLVLHLAAYDWMKSTHDERVHTARRYTRSKVKAILTAAGFDSVEIGYRNGALFPVMALWRLTLGRRHGASDTHAFPRWQDKLFYGIASLEDTIARTGLRLPYGGSVYARAVKR